MKEIFERARAMIIRPKATWEKIKGETNTVQDLFINYAAPLALIPAVATLIGLSLVGVRMPSGVFARAPFAEALTGGILGYVFHLLGLLAGAWAVNFLAPYFNSKVDFMAAVKLVVYSMTPVWLLGVLSALPGLGIVQIFGLYSIYLLYTGLPVLLDTPKEKALWYTVLVIIAAIIISLGLTIIVGGAVYGPMFMRMMAV
ncbi:MAG: Yip1 family protein [Candidatus Margulisbacteria bacterium]|nr:Yip1 family protein [Candidatus Margulisiibacteriota bacterium]